MRYREVQPTSPLASYIECFWRMESEATPPTAPPERLLPDGCLELILNTSARFREFDAAGKDQLQPARFVAGQMTRPVLVAPTGAVQLFGIRFAPGGSVPFLPVLPGELTDRITPLDDVASAVGRELSEALETGTTWREKLARVEAVLLHRLLAAPAPTHSLQPALRQLVATGGCWPIEQLAHELGLSQRQLQRRFLREVGLGPKLLARILRFQQVFRAVEGAHNNWADIAVNCGYFDQAHLIRDFHQFAGQTPAVLFDDFSRFTEMFTRKRRRSHFSNTPLAASS